MVFNQGAVMQPVQSSPLNMYTTTTTSDNNNVLMPTKKITMQNQDPFGSLLWKSRDACCCTYFPLHTNFCYSTLTSIRLFHFCCFEVCSSFKTLLYLRDSNCSRAKSFLFTLQAHPFFWWQIAYILLWLRCEETWLLAMKTEDCDLVFVLYFFGDTPHKFVFLYNLCDVASLNSQYFVALYIFCLIPMK